MKASNKCASRVLIKDGAMGTQLERWGTDCEKAGPMWSSSVLLSDMDLVQRVHKAYVDAGCDVLLTCTYQLFEEGCKASNITMSELVDYAVHTARCVMPSPQEEEKEEENKLKENIYSTDKVITHPSNVHMSSLFSMINDGSKRKILLAGSLGPYGSSLPCGEEYNGNYNVSESFLKEFHAGRLEAFIGNTDETTFLKVDFLLLETFPRLDEALIILLWMKQHKFLRTVPVCFSFVISTVKSFLPNNVNDLELEKWWNLTMMSISLPDGNSIETILSTLLQHRGTMLAGIGCNCTGLLEVSLVANILIYKKRQITEKPLALFLCPNSGEIYKNGQWCHAETMMMNNPSEGICTIRELQKILAQGKGDLRTCVKFILYLLKQRPEGNDWLFDIVICGGCCRSTPEDIFNMKKEIGEN